MDKQKNYRVRREWLLAERILGAVAIMYGMVPQIDGGWLQSKLTASGDLVTWSAMFTFFGFALMLTACVENKIRNHVPDVEQKTLKTFAWVRSMWHWGLLISYILAVTVLVSASGSSPLGLIFYQSCLFLTIHIAGGWEHVKAVHWCKRTEPFPTVVEYTRSRFSRRSNPTNA